MKQHKTGKVSFRRDNRGAAIITVLITMTLLIVLASVVLYTSLANLQMKKLDKEGKISFYNAETVMNEIRAGVQQAVSGAIEAAYSEVLVSYNTATKEEQTAAFKNNFVTALLDFKVKSEGVDRSLVTRSGSDYYYDPQLLMAFVSSQTGVAISGSGSVVVSAEDVRLRGIDVTYTANGYQTKVSADIRILKPELPYTSTSMKQSKAPDYAIIADGTLSQPGGGGTVTVTGSVYAGAVELSGANNKFIVNNAANFVSAGPVNVNLGSLTLNSATALWAGEITLNNGANLRIDGDAYVQDDLNLLTSAKATLNGRYFGFGNALDNADQSSAIIINGQNTVLDMTWLRTLLIAGHSFVNFGTDNGYVLMGESISVKSNQLVYMVPEGCLKVTNPYQCIGNPSDDDLRAMVALEPALAAYGITDPISSVQYIRKPMVQPDGQTVTFVYFCLKFPTAKAANDYFRDYFNANKPEIQKYLDLYSDGLIIPGGATANLAGNAFTFSEGAIPDAFETKKNNDDVLGPVIGAGTVSADTLGEIQTSYRNLCVTLSRTETAPPATPFTHFVNTADFDLLRPGEIKTYPEGDPGGAKVIVASGNYTIGIGTPSAVRLVIAKGDVTVDRDFSGLILAGGGVTLSSGVSVSSGRTLVSDALQALIVSDSDGNYYQFLNRAYISPVNVSGNGTDDAGIWDLNKLVTYADWSKNAS
jgi:Tfp pilus assembly protein PilX